MSNINHLINEIYKIVNKIQKQVDSIERRLERIERGTKKKDTERFAVPDRVYKSKGYVQPKKE